MITNPFHILIIFLGIIAFSLYLTGKYSIAKKISPILIILFLSAAASNLGIITTDNPFYNELTGYAVPFAVILILFHVKLADLKNAGVTMLAAFGIASIGSVVGCIAGGIILSSEFNEILSNEGWKLVGPYIGTYIGGSLNFFSLWTGLEINNANLFAAANAVDNLTLMPVFLIWILAPNYLMKFYKPGKFWKQKELDAVDHSEKITELKILHLAALTFWALLIMFLSSWIKQQFIAPLFPNLPTILITTTLALIFAQFKFIQNLQGANDLGNFAFYLFFAAVGALMDIIKAIELAPVLFMFVLIVIVSQVSFALVIGKLAKLDLRIIAVASVAAKAGPSSVAAITSAKDWNDLALPGIAAGLLGYAVGNYIGFGGAYLLKLIIG
ncbi:MAG: DUF819 family protein [Melioribacteraceae bacterium]|nr:DUF819 family protein [Melioribacteraceae bacterium]